MQLGDVTQIIIGSVLSRKKIIETSNNVKLYQIFSIRSYEAGLPYDILETKEKLDENIARKGDVIFRLALPLKVMEVDEQIEGKLISSQYCIIRPYDDKYKTKFLMWLLQSENVKRQLETRISGTITRLVPVSTLRQIDLPDIDPFEQDRIIKIIDSWDEQKKLYLKLIEDKEKYYNSLINKFIDGGNK